MPDANDYLEEVGRLLRDLARLNFRPILVGGMALVTLGSRRVTRDFDFVISQPNETLEALVQTFYRCGLELASKLDKNGEITATIDNFQIAAFRIRMDEPLSVYFLNPKTGLRVDILFDFPISAQEWEKTAKKIKIGSFVFQIASEEDLFRMKIIAKESRSNAGDIQDLEFLIKRLK